MSNDDFENLVANLNWTGDFVSATREEIEAMVDVIERGATLPLGELFPILQRHVPETQLVQLLQAIMQKKGFGRNV